jgi:hypothetical protein
LGTLTIENGTGLDAAVKLITAIPPRRQVWMLYLRANDKRTVTGVGVGNYVVRFALGLDWDATNRRFLRNSQFYEMGEQLNFTENTAPSSDFSAEVTHYDEIEITLHEVLSGNIRRVAIDESEFNEGE